MNFKQQNIKKQCAINHVNVTCYHSGNKEHSGSVFNLGVGNKAKIKSKPMNIIDIKEELERVDRLIRLKATGSPKDLAEKLQVSERHVYRIINQLKEIGYPVYFNKDRCSYCYSNEGKLIFKFSTNELDKNVMNKIKGGRLINNFNILLTDSICQWEDVSLL